MLLLLGDGVLNPPLRTEPGYVSQVVPHDGSCGLLVLHEPTVCGADRSCTPAPRMPAVPEDQLTVTARIRHRTEPGQAASDDVRAEQATAASYEAARDEIRARLADGEQVLYWTVDRSTDGPGCP